MGPQWVIDTEKGCIVPGHFCPRYIALSYRWGAVSGFVLTSANLTDAQKPNFLDCLPRDALQVVLLEAMDLVEALGEKYLWVDRLCIVQDSTNDEASDVHAMDKIYSGAHLTIIAAVTETLHGCTCWMRRSINRPGREGTFTEATQQATRPRILHDERCKVGRRHDRTKDRHGKRADSSQPPKRDLEKIVKKHYIQLLASDWARRGWTFQEQILSRRCVIFLDNDFFWDCKCSVWDEKSLTLESDTSVGGDFAEMATRMSSHVIPDFPLYLELVCLYNSRDLTYTGDGLRAITGVLQHFCRSYPGGLVSGLPRLFLDAALLWQPVTTAKRRVAGTDQLPSWSWCGWQCTVDPESLIPGLEGYDERYSDRWAVRNLVQWSVISDDASKEEAVEEPQTLDEYKQRANDDHDPFRDGWVQKRIESSILSVTEVFDTGEVTEKFIEPSFKLIHPLDPARRYFRNPFPVSRMPPSKATENLWPYLTCVTRSATFVVNAIYTPVEEGCHPVPCANFKTSAFDLPVVRPETAIHQMCRVISLAESNMNYAGVLRLMDDEEVNIGQEVELIAISTGSAKVNHLLQQCEESVLVQGEFNCGCSTSRKGRFVLYERRSAEGTRKRGRPWANKWDFERGYSSSPDSDFLEGWCDEGEWKLTPEAAFYGSLRKHSSAYDFYNVLWVEKRDGKAYRKGLGRVVKAAWDKNCGEPSKIIIG